MACTITVSDRCCCGCCHVRTGTWILIVAEFVLAALSVFQGFVGLGLKDRMIAREVILIIIGILFVISTILVIIALVNIKPQLMIIHMMMSLGFIFWNIVNLVWYIAIAAGSIATGTIIMQVLLSTLIIALMVYLLYVEYSCYIWLGEEIGTL